MLDKTKLPANITAGFVIYSNLFLQYFLLFHIENFKFVKNQIYETNFT